MNACPERTVRVLVLESQVLFAKALTQILSGDEELQAVADVASISLVDFNRLRPDVILVDIDDLSIDLVDVVRQSREALPNVRICALSNHIQIEVMERCIAEGAEGFVVKDVTPPVLIQAIKTIASGSLYVDPRIAGGLLRRRNATQGRPGLNELSHREVEIVRLIARGLSNRDIGGNLCLSEKTVKNHVSRIFTKLNVTARTQAAVHAIRSGMA